MRSYLVACNRQVWQYQLVFLVFKKIKKGPIPGNGDEITVFPFKDHLLAQWGDRSFLLGLTLSHHGNNGFWGRFFLSNFFPDDSVGVPYGGESVPCLRVMVCWNISLNLLHGPFPKRRCLICLALGSKIDLDYWSFSWFYIYVYYACMYAWICRVLVHYKYLYIYPCVDSDGSSRPFNYT